ncbi:MAG: hypothetical protein DRP81_05975 [Candidatus Omnitrophota bacterium]|nr:MAG: hypothetical protein DRP81_05975 [Candidatus Omnitrophota bacterium]
MNQELDKIIEKIRIKEDLAERIGEQAREEYNKIVGSAYQERKNIFDRVKRMYEEKKSKLREEILKQTEEGKARIYKEGEQVLEKLREQKQEIVKKLEEFLISQIDGYREG